MNHPLLAFCRWLENTPLAMNILGSSWAYPYVQLIHFTGLSLWVGTNLALDLRLLGIGRKRQTAAQLSAALFAWNWTGFGIAITGGFLLFSTTAVSYLQDAAFRVKLGMLVPLGLVLHIVNQLKAQDWGQQEDTPTAAKIAGLVELLVWFCVITAAVLIPAYLAEPG